VALAELIVWVNRALNFDYGNPGLQDEASHSWFSDLGVSYSVGLFDFSLWLVGLTVVVTTAAVAYGFWSARERLGVYLGLLLFLEGATVGVFAAQDLLLFYVFWEAMMIPLYILIGVWGGPGRRRDDQVRRLHPRGLAAHARVGDRARALGRHLRHEGDR